MSNPISTRNNNYLTARDESNRIRDLAVRLTPADGFVHAERPLVVRSTGSNVRYLEGGLTNTADVGPDQPVAFLPPGFESYNENLILGLYETANDEDQVFRLKGNVIECTMPISPIGLIFTFDGVVYFSE